MGYRWQPTDTPMIRPVDPPALQDGDSLLFDLPGRCGGVDSHSHHYRIVKTVGLYLLVKHGGGEERIYLSNGPTILTILDRLSDDECYWMVHAIDYAHSTARRYGRDQADARWRLAAAEKRIKTRKQRGSNLVSVRIVDF